MDYPTLANILAGGDYSAENPLVQSFADQAASDRSWGRVHGARAGASGLGSAALLGLSATPLGRLAGPLFPMMGTGLGVLTANGLSDQRARQEHEQEMLRAMQMWATTGLPGRPPPRSGE